MRINSQKTRRFPHILDTSRVEVSKHDRKQRINITNGDSFPQHGTRLSTRTRDQAPTELHLSRIRFLR